MAVNVKLGVDLSGFNSGIKTGQGILKGLNAEMKATEAEFKATGNAEQALANKTKILNSQIQAQKGVANEAQQALDKLASAGVSPADTQYQKYYATLMNATAGMNEAQAALNALDGSQQAAAASADTLTNSVQGIGKKISLDQVISGINKITDGLENAAKKAVQFGQQLWDTIMDSARRADDTATMAQMYGITIEKYQQMQSLVRGGMDTSVESILSAQQKLMKGIGKDSKEAMGYLREFGLIQKQFVGKSTDGFVENFITNDSLDLLFRAGQAIMAMGDGVEAEAEKEAAAQALFGKSWKDLVPLFEEYKTVDEYNAALAEQTVNSEEAVRNLAELNDAVGALEDSWTKLKDELISAIAPALAEAATSISGLLDSLTEYLKSDEGQELLSNLGDAVRDLLSGISKISAEDVVKGFSSVLGSLTEGLTWIADNGDTVTGIITGLAGAFGLLKVSSSVLEFVKLASGLSGMFGGGAAAGAGAATGAGSAAGGGLVNKVKNAGELFGAAGGWTVAGPAAVFAAAGVLGKKMIEANLNDANLNAIYGGNGGEGDIVDTMSQEAVRAAKAYWDVYTETGTEQAYDARDRLFEILSGEGYENTEQGVSLIENILDNMLNGSDPDGLGAKLQERFDQLDGIDVTVTPEVGEGANAAVAEQIGVVKVPLELVPSGMLGSILNFTPHANGLPYVPYDGYLAQLHKGERVVPAREVNSRNYSSNLYVESMYMNNGTDAAGLASAMAAAQRRTMSGYGS